MKFVCDNSSVATKNGNNDGTIEFAHKISPFFAADRFVLEKITRQLVNSIRIDGNIICFNLKM